MNENIILAAQIIGLLSAGFIAGSIASLFLVRKKLWEFVEVVDKQGEIIKDYEKISDKQNEIIVKYRNMHLEVKDETDQ